MCTNLRRLTNHYTGDDMYVKCGRCEACLMEKANARTERIRTEYSSDYVVLFVTLTYDKTSCPFVYLDDLYSKLDVLPLYRAFSVRYVPRKRSDGSIIYVQRRTYEDTELARIVNPKYDSLYHKGLHCLQKFGKRVGIAYYKDLQDFYKRLRQNLIRNYGFHGNFKAFSCSEYGSRTKRPHFHLLLFVPQGYDEVFREAIVKSWPFACEHRTRKYIEFARDAASYVASYVNCNSSLHPFLSQNFKVKHSASKFFGHNSELYSLPALLQMLSRRDMSIAVQGSGIESSVSFVPCPKYVINRFFPLFKGASRLPRTALLEFIHHPAQYAVSGEVNLVAHKAPSSSLLHHQYIDYSSEDIHKICVRLDNAFAKYHAITGKGRLDYALDYYDIWQAYKSTCHRLWRTDDKVCDLYKFDNLIDLVNGVVHSPYHEDLFDNLIAGGACFIIDPNHFPQNVASSRSLTDLFEQKDKTRKVINSVMVAYGHYV